MDQQQAENLRILIRHADSMTRELDMQQTHTTCGSPACMLGEANLIASLHEAMGGRPCGLTYLDRARRAFGLPLTPALHLFGTRGGNAWKRNDVTGPEWATEARKVLAENGYSMEAPNNAAAYAFQLFMDKVREPVNVEERHSA